MISRLVLVNELLAHGMGMTHCPCSVSDIVPAEDKLHFRQMTPCTHLCNGRKQATFLTGSLNTG